MCERVIFSALGATMTILMLAMFVNVVLGIVKIIKEWRKTDEFHKYMFGEIASLTSAMRFMQADVKSNRRNIAQLTCEIDNIKKSTTN